MKAEHIEHFLKQLGCDKINARGEWVYSSCPFAPWKHRKARDEHPSFSVAVDLQSVSGARCHACGFKGSLLELLWMYQRLAKKQMNELADFVRANNGANLNSITEGIMKRRAAEAAEAAKPAVERKPEPVFDWNREVAGIKGVQVDWLRKLDGKDDLPVLPNETLARFKPCTGAVFEYLTGNEEDTPYGRQRNLTPEMVARWELCFDERYNSITIPIRDCKQRLVAYSQRAFVPKDQAKKGPKYRHTYGFKRDFYLYGEQFWPEEGKGGTGYLVEGFFDSQRLQWYGYNVGAVMGTSLSEFQLEKLVRYFERLVIVPDGDEPGIKASRQWYERCSIRLPTTVARTPMGFDPQDFTRQDAFTLLGAPA